MSLSLLVSAFLTAPLGSLMGCDYYRSSCGVPVGAAASAALALPHALALELTVSADVMLGARPEGAITPTLGLWWRVELDERWAVYPRVDLGAAWFPEGFEGVAPYFDVGGGALWRFTGEWCLRAEVGLRGIRVGIARGG